LNFPQFSDVLTQFGAGLNNNHLFGKPNTADVAPPQGQNAGSLADVLTLSSPESGLQIASFDRQDPSSIAVSPDGIYRPKQVQQQFSSSLNFSFSASLSRATVVQRQNTQGSPSLAREMESSQFSYSSQALSARRSVGDSFSEVRRFQTDMSFSRTRTLSQQLSPEMGQKLESTGRQVARQFEIEISLDASFMRQFNTQTEGLSTDENMLGQYLDGTSGLAGQSGQALQAFFDEVDQILADTQSFVTDTMGSFLTDVKAAFGMSTAEADAFNTMVVGEVASFFKDVDAFLSQARSSMLAGPETPPELTGQDSAKSEVAPV
jgi:hypothetical protein